MYYRPITITFDLDICFLCFKILHKKDIHMAFDKPFCCLFCRNQFLRHYLKFQSCSICK